MANNPAHGRTSGTMEKELTPGQCILCSQRQPRQLKEYDVKEIISRWSVDFNLDVSEEFASYHTFHLYRCAHCGLDFFYPLISGSDRLYSGLQRFDWYYMGDKWEFQEALKDIKPGSQVLEIGCGMGSFIRIAKENGLRIEGIELNDQAVQWAKDKNLPVSNQDIMDLADAYPGTYDAVCSFQVLEHVPDPAKYLNACVKVLKDGGYLVISVPNNGSFLRHASADLLNQPPHHLSRWNRKSLQNLTRLLPLKLVREAMEPLAAYHRDWYISVQKSRIPDRLPFSRTARRSIGTIFSSVLEPSGLARKIHGHTIYVCYKKSLSQ